VGWGLATLHDDRVMYSLTKYFISNGTDNENLANVNQSQETAYLLTALQIPFKLCTVRELTEETFKN
jgi:hypothetical protein